MDAGVPDEVRAEIRSVVGDVLDKGGATWEACADAGLLGLAASEQHGGEGLGLGELGVLLRELGRRAVDLPVWETLVCGLLTLDRDGTPEQAARFVPDVVAVPVPQPARSTDPSASRAARLIAWSRCDRGSSGPAAARRAGREGWDRGP